MNKIKIFFDADAIFTLQHSETGASRALTMIKDNVELHTSSLCVQEAELALTRKTSIMISEKLYQNFKIHTTNKQLDMDLAELAKDKYDIHVLQSALHQKVNFLVSYNLKHYLIVKIWDTYQVKVLAPGEMLQRIRDLY